LFARIHIRRQISELKNTLLSFLHRFANSKNPAELYYKSFVKMPNEEPQKSTLEGKQISFFDSYEDAQAASDSAAAAKAPEQRLADTVQLILRTYGVTEAQLKERIRDNRLKIIQS
jgi:hypothetical protein